MHGILTLKKSKLEEEIKTLQKEVDDLRANRGELLDKIANLSLIVGIANAEDLTPIDMVKMLVDTKRICERGEVAVLFKGEGTDEIPLFSNTELELIAKHLLVYCEATKSSPAVIGFRNDQPCGFVPIKEE